jgi:hypothetical protein
MVAGGAEPVSEFRQEPFVDQSYLDGGLVADGELVISGRRGAVAFEAVDAALDGWRCL